MNPEILAALQAGAHHLTVWADLLDRINVFPVADGDTGRNLVLSISPLLGEKTVAENLQRELLFCSRGNSGNIANRFLSALLECGSPDALHVAYFQGRDSARAAVKEPKSGTMLDVFDALCSNVNLTTNPERMRILAEVVRTTPLRLPKLKAAGVVDAGALGMYLFLEGFLNKVAPLGVKTDSLVEIFAGGLTPNPTALDSESDGEVCVDLVLDGVSVSDETLANMGESVVVTRADGMIKVHLHGHEEGELKAKLSALGKITRWSADNLAEQTIRFAAPRAVSKVHLVTDAAGTFPRREAEALGVTLLESYINFANKSVPETRCDPEELYSRMKAGERVATSQASDHERKEHYQRILASHTQSLYLAVGSVYTGNVAAMAAFKKAYDPCDCIGLVDSGAASGRLGLAAWALSLRLIQGCEIEEAKACARWACATCREIVCLERLEYLARGGRLSKTSAFFGDLLHMRPLITPTSEGAKKIAVKKTQAEQLGFVLDEVERAFLDGLPGHLLLEYTDNRAWVEGPVFEKLSKLAPKAQARVAPMSLTSGVHMGPGTFGVSYLVGDFGGSA